MSATPPTRIKLGGDLVLRLLRISDAGAIALAVRQSLEHLKPWMPWADQESTRDAFQRQRLRGARHKAAIGDEWQYGVFPRDESSVVGAFGLMARKWPATIEIGYWVHVDAIGHGIATRASAALTNASLGLDGITTVCIRCDEANERSAAVPRRLGFTLARTESRAPQAPGELGQLMTWERKERVVTDP